MQEIKIKDLTIGKGRPKLCIPLVSPTEKQLEAELRLIKQLPCQLVEWRVDFYLNYRKDQPLREEQETILRILAMIKMQLDVPVIYTIRTKNQGGELNIPQRDYIALNMVAAESKLVDVIDLEANFADENTIKKSITQIHKQQVKIILSDHDFLKTPPAAELLESLIYMQQLGADIPKLAVMPRKKEDVQSLLEVALAMRDHYARGPFIVVAMGELGLESRVCGGKFGSAITFAAGKRASAPGQIDAVALDRLLSQYYGGL